MNPIVQDLLTARRMLRDGSSLIDAAIAAYLVQGQLASIPQDIPPRASPRSST